MEVVLIRDIQKKKSLGILNKNVFVRNANNSKLGLLILEKETKIVVEIFDNIICELRYFEFEFELELE